MLHQQTIILSFVLLVATCACGNSFDPLNTTPVTIEARYMQYACGDWNDDMRVEAVEDSSVIFLLGQDIDPLILHGPDILALCFFDQSGQTTTAYNTKKYRLTGYISKEALAGCENSAPQFWITEAYHLNGQALDLSAAEYDSGMR